METWALLGAYVLGFALLQILLYRYFVNRGSSSESTGPPTSESTGSPTGVSNAGSPMEGTPESDQGTPAAPDISSEDPMPGHRTGSPDGRSAGDVLQCGDCGAYNRQEQMFLYCRECGERL